ncbi:LysR substrate-binding domain-containing protein [Leptospira interrogans]
MSRSDLPHLGCLVAFECVARHLSISRAAEELSLTQGAISRQVSRLEASMNVKLFNRVRQRLSLTASGDAYLLVVREALDAVAKVAEFGSVGRSNRNVIRVAVQPAFARQFLLHRLPGFYAAYPSYTIDVECFLDYTRLRDEDYDAIIYFGRPDSRRQVHEILMQPDFTPVCNSSYSSMHGVRDQLNLNRITFLQSSVFPELWGKWFELNKQSMPRPFRRISFNDYATAEEAALAGLGIALLPTFLTAENLRSGRLSGIPGAPVKESLFYLMSYPIKKANKEGLGKFRRWLVDEVRAWERSLAAPRRPSAINASGELNCMEVSMSGSSSG